LGKDEAAMNGLLRRRSAIPRQPTAANSPLRFSEPIDYWRVITWLKMQKWEMPIWRVV